MTHCNSRGDTSLVILAAGRGRRFGGEKQLATVGETGKPLMYFSVTNADDYYGPGAMTRLFIHLEEHSDWAMLSYALGNTLSGFGAVNRGLCRVQDGFLEGISECLDIERIDSGIRALLNDQPVSLEPYTPVSMNIWAFGRHVFERLEKVMECFFAAREISGRKEFYLPEQVMSSIRTAKARVRVYPSREKWQGVTYREDLAVIGGLSDGRN